MIGFGAQTQVYLAAGATDMRKQIDGLAALVVDVLGADPFSSHLFVFCNRGRDKLKILYWHNNGFWLCGIAAWRDSVSGGLSGAQRRR
jgi:transposase